MATSILLSLWMQLGLFLLPSQAYYFCPSHLQATRTSLTKTKTKTSTTSSSSSLMPLFVKRRNNNNANRHHRRIKKSNDVLAIEKDLSDRGYYPIIGSDESGGGGCIAGPVVAASCCILQQDLSQYTPIEGVGDSKTLTPETRERIYKQVTCQPDMYAWRVSFRNNTQIDSSNILVETMECFRESIEALVLESLLVTDDDENRHRCNAYSIVDGKKSPKLSSLDADTKIPCRPWVKGDAEVYTVALASIIAKVTRDQLSSQWHSNFPQYRFDIHHGYATKDHIEAIHKYGPCPLHRMSFKSLKGR